MAVKKILSELQIKKIFTLIKDNFAKLNHTHDKATTTTMTASETRSGAQRPANML